MITVAIGMGEYHGFALISSKQEWTSFSKLVKPKLCTWTVSYLNTLINFLISLDLSDQALKSLSIARSTFLSSHRYDFAIR